MSKLDKTSASATASSETAVVLSILRKLGVDSRMTIGNAETGESYPLPPHVAAVIRQVLTHVAVGKEVAVTEPSAELTPNEVAAELNVSRTYVMKLLEEGVLPYRMVGNHHRIPYADVAAYKEQQQARSRSAMEEIYALDRELGPIFDPPPDKSVYRTKGRRDE